MCGNKIIGNLLVVLLFIIPPSMHG